MIFVYLTNIVKKDKMRKYFHSIVEAKLHKPSELIGMEVIWKKDFLGIVKGVEINFNEEHVSNINGHKTLFISKGEKVGLFKGVAGSRVTPYFICKLTNNGKSFVSIERIHYERKNIFNGIKNWDFSFKVVYLNTSGHLEIKIYHTWKEATSLVKMKLKEHTKYWNENTLFDRIMKKYFSFYK